MSATIAGVVAALPAAASSSVRARRSSAAHLYWSEPESSRGPSGSGINTIWRATLKGSSIKRDFITGLQIPGDVALAGQYLYWLDTEASEIGRAQLNGTHVERNFLGVQGTTEAIAVDGRHIYWSTGSYAGHQAEIWRANLNGSHKQKLLSIGTGIEIAGLAVNSRHIFWTNRDKGTIGRADKNGAHPRRGFITGLTDPTGLALDRRHLYWASTPTGGSGSIGRADLAGRNVRQHFIPGATEPFGVAVGAGHVYWADPGAGTIGRARVDGTHVRPDFIHARVLYMGSDGADPGAVAVGP